MALIKCPECGNNVSDKAKVCIHCGYPIQSIKDNKLYRVIIEKLNYDGTQKDKSELLLYCANFLRDNCNVNHYKSIECVKKLPYVVSDGLTKENAEYIVKNLSKLYFLVSMKPSSTRIKSQVNEVIHRRIYNIDDPIECPRCHSQSISTNRRGYNIITGFIGANKTVNRCAKCGYTWTPTYK